MASEEELGRLSAIGDDGAWLTVVAFRLIDVVQTPRGVRRVLGAKRWKLSTGEPLTLVDGATYLVTETGEMVCLRPASSC